MLKRFFGGPAAPSVETNLDAEWHRCLVAVAAENGHAPAALATLPEADWQALIGFVVARMSNGGYVPIAGWQAGLSALVKRPSDEGGDKNVPDQL